MRPYTSRNFAVKGSYAVAVADLLGEKGVDEFVEGELDEKVGVDASVGKVGEVDVVEAALLGGVMLKCCTLDSVFSALFL